MAGAPAAPDLRVALDQRRQAEPPWRDGTPGVPQTNAGDLKMVIEWWRLSFVRHNPWLPPGDDEPTTVPPPQNPPYISVERTKRDDGKEETP